MPIDSLLQATPTTTTTAAAAAATTTTVSIATQSLTHVHVGMHNGSHHVGDKAIGESQEAPPAVEAQGGA
jgi:cobalamin biosynthesis protein CbiD